MLGLLGYMAVLFPHLHPAYEVAAAQAAIEEKRKAAAAAKAPKAKKK
mgnify:CR=1 FL=1